MSNIKLVPRLKNLNFSRGFTPYNPESPELKTNDKGISGDVNKKNPHPLRWGYTGFTLAEILVAVSIGIIIILLVYVSHNLMVSLTERGSKKIELVQNGRVALDRLTRELRQSDEIVTVLPETGEDPANLPPSEIQFQDGHNPAPIRYIRYYLEGNLLHREISYYYFSVDSDTWVSWDTVDGDGASPLQAILEDNIIAEYLGDLAFWGEDRLVNIELNTISGENKVEFYTKVCGRNLR